MEVITKKKNNRIRKYAFFSFFVFLIICAKDIMVYDFGLLAERSLLNRNLDSYFILPLILLGTISSLIVIIFTFLNRKGKKTFLFDLNLLLVFPLVFLIIYTILNLLFFITKTYLFDA